MEKKSVIQKNDSQSVVGIIATIILGLYSLTMLFTVAWALISSVKGPFDFFDHPFGWPEEFRWKNYITAFEVIGYPISTGQGYRTVYLFEMFGWSFLYCIATTIITQLSRCCCAYVCAKFRRYRVARLMYNVIIIVMILPILGNLAGNIRLAKTVGYYDNFLMHLVTCFGFTGGNVLIYYASFKNVSWEYAEAAFMDGATHYDVLIRIMIPMIKTSLLALMLLEFKAHWNDYSYIMVYQPSLPNLALGIYKMQFDNSGLASEIPIQLAGCTLAIMPILIMYLVFQDKLIGNVAIGGLKG